VICYLSFLIHRFLFLSLSLSLKFEEVGSFVFIFCFGIWTLLYTHTHTHTHVRTCVYIRISQAGLELICPKLTLNLRFCQPPRAGIIHEYCHTQQRSFVYRTVHSLDFSACILMVSLIYFSPFYTSCKLIFEVNKDNQIEIWFLWQQYFKDGLVLFSHYTSRKYSCITIHHASFSLAVFV
jgi:hypothetical protein